MPRPKGSKNKPKAETTLTVDQLNEQIAATEAEITAIRDFARSLKNVVGYELLPYHPFGEDKWQALGREPVRFSVPTTEQMQALRACAVLNK